MKHLNLELEKLDTPVIVVNEIVVGRKNRHDPALDRNGRHTHRNRFQNPLCEVWERSAGSPARKVQRAE